MLQPTTPLGRPRRGTTLGVVTAWAAGLACIIAFALAGREPSRPAPVTPSAEAAAATPAPSQPPASPLIADTRISLVRGPMGVTVGAGAAWVVTLADLRLRRIDPATNDVTAIVDLPFIAPAPTASPLATASGETAFATTDSGPSPDGRNVLPVVAVGGGSVWVLGVPYPEVLVRVDPKTAEVIRAIRLPVSGTGLVSGPAGTWVTTDAGLLFPVDTARGALGRAIKLGEGRVAAAAGTFATWVSAPDGRIVGLDARGRVTATLTGGGGPIAVEGGSVWVRSDRTLVRIDEWTGLQLERRDVSRRGDDSAAWSPSSVPLVDYSDTGAPLAPRETWVADTGWTLWVCRPEDGEIWRIETPPEWATRS